MRCLRASVTYKPAVWLLIWNLNMFYSHFDDLDSTLHWNSFFVTPCISVSRMWNDIGKFLAIANLRFTLQPLGIKLENIFCLWRFESSFTHINGKDMKYIYRCNVVLSSKRKYLRTILSHTRGGPPTFRLPINCYASAVDIKMNILPTDFYEIMVLTSTADLFQSPITVYRIESRMFA